MEKENFNGTSPDVPIYTATDMLTHRWNRGRSPGIRPPDAVILTYQPVLMDYVARQYPIQKVTGFFSDLYLLKTSAGKVAITGNFGVGAPAAAIVLEELAAFGVRQFVSIGLAGGLQPALLPGTLVLLEAARRDEGTSAHYAATEELVQADPGLLKSLAGAMQARGLPAQVGASWTTDAPYRETWKKVESFRKEGLLTVEMEAAAAFGVGQALKLQVGAAVIVADPLLRRSWNTSEEEKLIQQNLQKLLDAVVAMFLRAGKG